MFARGENTKACGSYRDAIPETRSCGKADNLLQNMHYMQVINAVLETISSCLRYKDVALHFYFTHIIHIF